MDIANKSVVITGGASGLGAACVYQLVLAGAKVAILDKQIESAKKIAQDMRGVIAIPCDVTQAEEVERAFQEVKKELGEARIVVNCAGIVSGKRLVGREGPMPVEEFEKVIQVNLMGTFHVMRCAANIMATLPWTDKSQSCGVIINTASIAAFEGQVGQMAYSAAKGGIVSMTLPAARELARWGIRVMAIAPGVFATPMMKSLSQEVQEGLIAQVPCPHRLGEPNEFAQLVQHIIQNEMLNGSVIRLDGALRMS